MKEHYQVTLDCLFCSNALQAEENATFESGDMIKCSTCGELNDYDSTFSVAKEKGVNMVREEATKYLNNQLNKTLKKFK